ncbi:MAG TPA: hypothetical protein VKQ11_23190 [Candidatus Sulfotelmatobacter sp.]|nr:hypothetical protein [Candidatus Sulfotelmatobacter sp.]
MPISPMLAVHICAGTVGLLSGGVAMAFRKGSRRHGIAGKVFVASMVGLGASAMYLALRKHEVGNFIGGILTIYLVTTAWLTARRKDGETSVFDWAALLIPTAVGISTLTLGIEKLNHPAAFHDGVPVGMNFFLGAVVLLAAVGDVRMLVSGISGTRRVARHLWRMCFGLFFASGSIFIARPHLFPAWMSTSYLLLFLGILPLLLMIFWLVRVRFKNAFQKTPPRDRNSQLGLPQESIAG